MRCMRNYKTAIIGSVVLLVVLLFLILPLDSVGYFCADDKFTDSCLCHRNVANPYMGEERQLVQLHKLQQETNVKCLMTIKPQGRLGNLMGEYASLYALARLNGRPAFIDPEMHEKLKDYFNLSLPVLDKALDRRLPWTTHELNDWMEPNYRNFSGLFVKLKGYPCSWTFYDHIREEIVREFTFKAHILNEVNAYLWTKRGNASSVTFVGVHIRRGDYVKLMQVTYNGVLADKVYLNDAMDFFRTRHKDALFVVCSDDLEWARENINSLKGDVVFGWNGRPSSPGHDMALLSSCNHSIMTIGTFGYWSSYLTGGDAVYLVNFLRSDSEFLRIFHYDAAYLPHWKGIAADLNATYPTLSGNDVVLALPMLNLCCLVFLAIFFCS